MNIVVSRLSNQHLSGPLLADPCEAVRWLGAVQAQEFQWAKWGVSLRTGATNAELNDLFERGKILRTHIMRPTWHFVLPEDILWMHQLTAPRVKKILVPYDRKLEIDDKIIKKSQSIFTKALSGGQKLTRDQLAEKLEAAKIPARGQRLAHIVIHAELDGVVCSGGLAGKKFTYAYLPERAPKAKILEKDEGLALLAKRYFQSHGPALAADFAWWSGLTVAYAKRGAQLCKANSEVINEKTYFFFDNKPAKVLPQLLLLPCFDEYLISYSDYSPVFSAEVKKLSQPFGNALSANIMVRKGLVIGGWRRKSGDTEPIKLEPLTKLKLNDLSAIKRQVAKYSHFVGHPTNFQQ